MFNGFDVYVGVLYKCPVCGRQVVVTEKASNGVTLGKPSNWSDVYNCCEGECERVAKTEIRKWSERAYIERERWR